MSLFRIFAPFFPPARQAVVKVTFTPTKPGPYACGMATVAGELLAE